MSKPFVPGDAKLNDYEKSMCSKKCKLCGTSMTILSEGIYCLPCQKIKHEEMLAKRRVGTKIAT